MPGMTMEKKTIFSPNMYNQLQRSTAPAAGRLLYPLSDNITMEKKDDYEL